MRNLDIILEDQKQNNKTLEGAVKRKEALDLELKELYNAVMAAMQLGTANLE